VNPPNDDVAALGAELEAAGERALLLEWKRLNALHFRHGMQPPVIALDDAETRLGSWTGRERTLCLARRLVLGRPWGVVVEVLKHEMAHQYVDEVLHAKGEAAHGESFRRLCAELAIDARAAGLPTGTADAEQDRVLGRVAKLLALAQSPNLHEAELAMQEARRLMLRHNLDAAGAGTHRAFGFRQLGEPTGRVQAPERMLGAILCTHFFVEAIWITVYLPRLGSYGSVLEVSGTETNLALAEYVHGFLQHTSGRLWREHKQKASIRSDRARRSFLVGVMRGFLDKLGADRTVQRAEGLVWVGDAGLRRYYEARYPRRRAVGRARFSSANAFREGQSAGREIVLHKPITPYAGNQGRLLTAGASR
jgi:hypothetical protein